MIVLLQMNCPKMKEGIEMIFGIHTFTKSATVTSSKAFAIIAQVKKYRDRTGEIFIKTDDDLDKSYRKLNAEFEIKYYGAKGITWRIRPSHEIDGCQIYCIEAKITPRILASGRPDYFTAANQADIKFALEKFAPEPSKISSLLSELTFKLNRIDFCIDFDIGKLGYTCTVDEMFKLIKCANIPHHFTERADYNETSHRMETDKTTFYLVSRSVVVNCYMKDQLYSVKP